MQQEIKNALRVTHLMSHMTEAEIDQVLASSDVRLVKYKKDEILFHEGDRPEKLYLLLRGKVRILKDTYQGRQIFLGEIRKVGMMFGEVYLFIEESTYDMYTQAITDVEVLEIGRSIFETEKLGTLGMKLQRNLLHDFAMKAYSMNNMLKVLASGSLRGKIARYLLLQPDRDGVIELKESRESTATYLAVSRPALSRELSAMVREGILNVKGKRIEILDRGLLEECI